jgi:hypothetical protein
MAMSIDRLSREYMWVQITSGQNLTAATLELAFTGAPDTRPGDLDWKAADYVDDGKIWARLLVSGTGAGGTVELAVGDWQCWVRITDTPERPVRRPGIVTIL